MSIYECIYMYRYVCLYVVYMYLIVCMQSQRLHRYSVWKSLRRQFGVSAYICTHVYIYIREGAWTVYENLHDAKSVLFMGIYECMYAYMYMNVCV